MKAVATTPLERELVSYLAEHPMSLPALKKTMMAKHEHTAGFEAVLSHALERMCKKHVVAHVAGHPHTFRLSKAMAAKVEKKKAAMRAKKAVVKKPAKKQGAKAKAGKAGKMMGKKKMMAKKA